MLCPTKFSKRGVALITVVMFCLVMTVVARGILKLQLGTTSRQVVWDERARQAALSGLEYAKSRLAVNPDWRGDGRGRVVDMPSMVVEEEYGNVIGAIFYPDGGKGQFRLRFNAEDGDGGLDGLPDSPPGSRYRVDNKLLSVNNLKGSSKVALPTFDDYFRAVVGGSPQGEVPSHCVLVQVEGRAGPGFEQPDLKSNPNSAPQGFVKTIRLESVLKVSLEQPSGPAVLQAAGDVSAQVNSRLEVGTVDNVTPSLRSKQSISVTGLGDGGLRELKGVDDNDIEVFTQNGQLHALSSPSTVSVQSESPNASFLQLTWDQVTKPQEDTAPVILPGGVYVLWPPADGVGEGELRYYDMTYKQYLEEVYEPHIQQTGTPGSGTVADPDPGQLFVKSQMASGGGAGGLGVEPAGISVEGSTVTVTEDLFIRPTKNSADFVLIPLAEAPMNSTDPRIPRDSVTRGGASTTNAPIKSGRPLEVDIRSRIYCQGDMAIKAATINVENATLIGEGDLVFSTPQLSVAANDEQNLSLYFQGEIVMSSYQPGDSKPPGGLWEEQRGYGDFQISGTVYSWGGLTAHLAEPGVESQGGLDFRGMLVAYGGDPSGDPGHYKGRGNVDLRAGKAALVYDPSTITQLVPPEELGDYVLSPLSFWIR